MNTKLNEMECFLIKEIINGKSNMQIAKELHVNQHVINENINLVIQKFVHKK
ncbi:hypothetical protein IJG72_07700 [bacterium]|nr:hypothetical protein [bacterium]